MKIVTLLDSPRTSGTSAAIAGRFIETAESLGAETKTFALNKLKLRGCQACMACGVNDVKDAEKREDIMKIAEETARRAMEEAA